MQTGGSQAERKKFKMITSWDDLGPIQYDSGVTSTRFVIGDPDDETAPLVMRGVFPPGHVVAPHSHPCDYTEIILEGTQQVGRTWLKAGDIRIVKAGTVYGPLTAGPEGATVMVIFRSGNWKTEWIEKRDAAEWAANA
jgi:quercetin dioxygenase-like cupin family protein